MIAGPEFRTGPASRGFPEGAIVYADQTYTGGWSSLTDTDNDQNRQFFVRLSAARVEEELHVCAVTDGGELVHAQRHNRTQDATHDDWGSFPVPWVLVGKRGGGEVGKFIDVACAAVFNPRTNKEELHICGLTADKIWHSVSPVTRPQLLLEFGAFADVEKSAIGEQGNFVAIDCAGNGGQLQLVAVTAEGRALHTIRAASGAWRQPEDVVQASTEGSPFSWLDKIQDVAIGYCNEHVAEDGPRDVSQLNVILRGDGRRLLHTIRSANPVQWSQVPPSEPTQWRPLQDLSAETRADGVWLGFSLNARPFFPSYTLNVVVPPGDKGSVSTTDERTIKCPTTCTRDFDPGSQVTLRALPDDFTTSFRGWSGDCSGTGDCVLEMNSHKTVVAQFG
jgi:hypothetical protein